MHFVAGALFSWLKYPAANVRLLNSNPKRARAPKIIPKRRNPSVFPSSIMLFIPNWRRSYFYSRLCAPKPLRSPFFLLSARPSNRSSFVRLLSDRFACCLFCNSTPNTWLMDFQRHLLNRRPPSYSLGRAGKRRNTCVNQ